MAAAVLVASLGLSGLNRAMALDNPLPSNSAQAPAFIDGGVYYVGTAYDSGPGSVSASTVTHNVPNQIPFYASASASVSLSPQPTLAASLSGYFTWGTDGYTAEAGPYASATSTYFFNVNGPSNIDVPVDVWSTLSASASTGSNFALGGYVIIEGQNSFETVADLFDICPGDGFISTCYIQDIVQNPLRAATTLVFSANSLVEVDMAAGVFSNSLTSSTQSATADVDPYFEIDPTFLANNPGYSLEFSSGVGNSPTSGVPEPAAWAMMFLGLGGIGAAMRLARRERAPRRSELSQGGWPGPGLAP